jgi:hypothetical protein
VVEFGIAIGAGIAAGSIALIGFRADSLIEAFAGLVVVWLFTGARPLADRLQLLRARRLHQRRKRARPRPGPPSRNELGRHVGQQLDSAATVKEGAQNMICAYLSICIARRAAAQRALWMVVG